MSSHYQQDLGKRLRAIRTMQGLTLQEVEERSDGEWKAVVIGSYERGDRAISVAKLARLAEFYGVPARELLPHGDEVVGTDHATDDVIIDLTAIDPAADGALGAVSRYARRIQVQRGDYNGRILTIRAADVDALAAACGISPDALLEQLEAFDAVHHDRGAPGP